MKSRIKCSLFLGIFILSVLALSSTSAAIEPATVQWNTTPSLPGESVLDDLLGRAGGVLDGVVNANVTGTNIYYYSYTLGPSSRMQNTLVPSTTNSSTFLLTGTDPATSLLMVSYLSRMDGNLTALNTNINTTIVELNGVNGFSTGWTDQAWKEIIAKEWFAINATYTAGLEINATNFNAFLVKIDTVHPLIPVPFGSMTPEEVMLATQGMIKPRDSFDNLWRAFYLDNDSDSITDFSIGPVLMWATPFVSAANSEITGRTSITLNYTFALDIHETKFTEDMAVFMLWDHDNSLANYVAAKRAHPFLNPGFKAFTGDEVLYMMHFYHITTTVWGSIQKTSTWRYDDGSVPTALSTLIHKFTATPYLAHLLGIATGDAKAELLRTLLFSNVTATLPEGSARVFTDASFSFAQLKVNALEMDFSLQDGLQVDKLDLWYGEHKFAGLFAYEDVNDNGIQDISVQGNAPFVYAVSAEARYRLRIDGATGRTLMAPTVTSNGVNFGINFTGISGRLVPVDQNDDAILLDNTIANSIPVNVDSIGFMFRFTVDTAAMSGSLKVDYSIGAFENATGEIEPAMDGLSLSMVSLGSMFRVMAGTRLVSNTAISNENAANINMSSPSASRIAKIRFGSGTSIRDRVFESDLSGIHYALAATPYNATGEVIPVMMGGIALGRSNPIGNNTQQSGVAIIGMVYLYSVNFPTWSGQAIVHDPVFSTFVSSSSGPGLWLYIGIALGGVAAIVIVLAVVRTKKRASSFPGMPFIAPGEVKTRPGTPRVDLLHSFFFHSSDLGHQDGGVSIQVDHYDPATFEFFAALVAVQIQELDPGVGSWATISIRDMDDVPSVDVHYLARLLSSRILLSSDKFSLDINMSRAYVYQVTLWNDGILQLLDIFTMPASDTILRISLCSRQSMAKEAYPSIEKIMHRLSTSLKGAAAGKYNEDTLESIIDRHFPVHLASPRRFTTNEVSGFLREARQDGQLTPGDLAEIEADLHNMDDVSAKRVSKAYKTSLAKDEMDASNPDKPGR